MNDQERQERITEVEITVKKVIEPTLKDHAQQLKELNRLISKNHETILNQLKYIDGTVKSYFEDREASAIRVKNEVIPRIEKIDERLAKVEKFMSPWVVIKEKLWTLVIAGSVIAGVYVAQDQIKDLLK